MKGMIIIKKLFFFSILILFITPVYAADTVDIGLFYGNNAKSSVSITVNGVEVLYNAADVSDDVFISSGGAVAIDGTVYRGDIILRKESDKVIVINRVNIEDYIASVLPKEMSPSFHSEALKVQAICARTFAANSTDRHKNSGFNLCATNHCQVYSGISSEAESTTEATRQTAGQLARYNGDPILAVYFATSGGHTEDNLNVWGSDTPYLKPVSDTYESPDAAGARWTRELSVERATEIMAGRGVGTVTNIEITEQTERGLVLKLKVTGTEGERVFTNEACRTAFGEITLSQAFSLRSSSKPHAYGGSIDLAAANLLSASGISISGGQRFILRGITDREFISENTKKDVFIFEGRGNGHLLGMSQNGANGMAANGYGYIEILKHYYTGIEVY